MIVAEGIPKRFIRIWLGPSCIPPLFEKWWREFQDIHRGWDFVTIKDADALDLTPPSLSKIYKDCKTYSGRSDVIRCCALHSIGGVYVDTDVMPLKSFDTLVSDSRPFAGKRSNVSFEAAVLGSPAQHDATKALIERFPEWYWAHRDKSNAVSTGPGFISKVWFGRSDVRHLPPKTFYPYNGFMAPKRDEKLDIFEKKRFPSEMIAAHFSNNRWGGKPRD